MHMQLIFVVYKGALFKFGLLLLSLLCEAINDVLISNAWIHVGIQTCLHIELKKLEQIKTA